MPTLIHPTPLETELRAVTDGQTASKIARALKRTHGVTTRDGLAHLYYTQPKGLRDTRHIGEQRFRLIENFLHRQAEIESPDERIERLTE